MPSYTVRLSETRDGKKREAVARDAEGQIAGAVIRGDSVGTLMLRGEKRVTATTPYQACVAVLEGQE